MRIRPRPWWQNETGAIINPFKRSTTLSLRIQRLAEANITRSGKAVVGHFPGYIQKAQSIGASYFDIGGAWNSLNNSERWAANRHFLDTIADAGDEVLLSLPKTKIRPNSWLADEVIYLTKQRGYQWVNQWTLRLPR
jgi:hypothetical protein